MEKLPYYAKPLLTQYVMVSVLACVPVQAALVQVPACPAAIVPLMKKVFAKPLPTLESGFTPPVLSVFSASV